MFSNNHPSNLNIINGGDSEKDKMGSQIALLSNPILYAPNSTLSQKSALSSQLNAHIGPSPKVRMLCEILARVAVSELEATLSKCGIPPLPEYVEEVLKLSYDYPAAAIKFFRWAGLSSKPSPLSWNLVVDLLGKNQLFEVMWDVVRSMKQEGVLSVATFVSVFGNYCRLGRFKEAIMSFEVMNRYGVPRDVFAVNSLLSAICREKGQVPQAGIFFEQIKTMISPDADTFAILLEGWEKEGNAASAKKTFGEMVIRVGWDSKNISAYDAFLNTLVVSDQVDDAIKFLKVMKSNNCLPGLKFFSNALDILAKRNDFIHAVALWEIMVSSGSMPSLSMYNVMIALHCNNSNSNNAIVILDDMPFKGVFPDNMTYNMIFQCLVRMKMVREAARFFAEMTKNESPPTPSNCAAAITMFFDRDDPETGIEVWNYMIDNQISPAEEASNALLIGLCKLDRLSEAKRYAEEMLDRRIGLDSSTMTSLKNAFYKGKMEDTFDRFEKRRKGH